MSKKPQQHKPSVEEAPYDKQADIEEGKRHLILGAKLVREANVGEVTVDNVAAMLDLHEATGGHKDMTLLHIETARRTFKPYGSLDSEQIFHACNITLGDADAEENLKVASQIAAEVFGKSDVSTVIDTYELIFGEDEEGEDEGDEE